MRYCHYNQANRVRYIPQIISKILLIIYRHRYSGASKPKGNDAFCVTGNVGGNENTGNSYYNKFF